LQIFIDFDGTITKKDVGNEIFKVFGRFEPYHTQLINNDISIFQYWHTVCSTISGSLNNDKLKEFASEFEVDSYFSDFANYCKNSGISTKIVSDGFHIYIDTILEKEGLGWIPVFCNYLCIDDGETKLHFPYSSETCTCKCASCKRNMILTNVSENDIIVFIGDGYSDFCAAEHSDIVFAKGALAAYCSSNRIPHYTFSSFFDVLRLLKLMIEKNKLRTRHQAKLKRIKAYETE
jgi:2-hydroxy-3-keto-5-methylthiopentenyl-1-phosphate phosphatase